MLGGLGIMGSWMIFGIILFILFWLGIIWLIVWGVKTISHGGNHHHYTGNESRSDAMTILKERYARGEITKEQFNQMKKDLM